MNKTKRGPDSFHPLIIAFLIMPFLLPTSISNGDFLSTSALVYKAWKAVAIVVLCYLVVVEQHVFDLKFLCLLAFFVVAVSSTAVHGGLVSQQLNLAISWLACFVLVSVLARRNPLKLINVLFWVYYAFIIVNAITLIVFPGALYYSETGMRNWFLGDRNVFIAYLIPALCVALLRDEMRGQKISLGTIILWAMSFAELVFVWSATSLTVYFALSLLLFGIVVANSVKCRLNIRVYLIIVTVVFLAFVVFRLQDYAAAFIVQVLQKDLSLTGRTFIWDEAMAIIAANPLFGQGMQQVITLIPVWDGDFSVLHAHSFYLQVLCVGGFVGFAFLVSFFLLSTRGIEEFRMSRSAAVVSVCVGAALLGLCFDYYHATSFCVLISLMAFFDLISKPIRERDSDEG